MEKGEASLSIRAGGATLKKNGNSNYWIFGQGFRVGDPVSVKKSGTNDNYWSGTVQNPVSNERARVQLRFAGPDADADLGNYMDVTVTVTSGNLTATYSDTVVIDAPGG